MFCLDPLGLSDAQPIPYTRGAALLPLSQPQLPPADREDGGQLIHQSEGGTLLPAGLAAKNCTRSFSEYKQPLVNTAQACLACSSLHAPTRLFICSNIVFLMEDSVMQG